MNYSTATEKELRDAKAPWPKTMDELTSFISTLTERHHDYGTCVYAMSLSAVAAFNFVSHKLGVTGFQASCADLSILRQTRSIKGPFMLVKAEDALFPQSDPQAKFAEAMGEWEPWLKDEATKKLAETDRAHPNVLRHWAKLAGVNGAYEDKAKFLEGEYDWTDKFVEEHAEDFKRFGIERVYLMRNNGDVSKADAVEDGCSHRLTMPVSLSFKRSIDGITVEWSDDMELDGSNGKSGYRFDWEKLSRLESEATGVVREFISSYIARAKAESERA